MAVVTDSSPLCYLTIIAPLIIDEKTGREIAAGPAWNLNVIGTLGVLEQAAYREFIDLREAVRRLASTRFHIQTQLVEEALRRDAERQAGRERET
jgi:predicted nucleic acid-binding protein